MEEVEVFNVFQVYAKTDNAYVSSVYSTCFYPYEEGDTLIKEGSGDEFVHVGYYQIYDERMCHNYKIIDGEMIECTKEEKELEYKQIQDSIIEQPTETELLQQQVADLEIQLILNG